MSKTKSRNKENYNQPGEQGIFYAQKLCPNCKTLIVGRSEETYRQAELDLVEKLKAHRKECQKQSKQLNMPMVTSGKQTETISRVSLRGEKKSV